MIFANFTNTTKDPPLCISITLCIKYNYPLNCHLDILFTFNPFMMPRKMFLLSNFKALFVYNAYAHNSLVVRKKYNSKIYKL